MRPNMPALEARQSQASKNSEKKNRAKDYVGDKLRRKKNKESTRIILSNVAGITGSGGDEKMEEMKIQCLKFNPDVTLITEVGQNEKRIRSEKTLYERTKGWWETTTSRIATNRHFDSGSERQFGGVAIVAQGEVAHRIIQTEKDPTGLGRWTSILISGKKGKRTRIISAYRPTVGSNTAGSVSMQHHLYFYQNQEVIESPRKKFMKDLTESIKKWKNDGEQIILGGDMNTGDKPSKNLMQRFWSPFLEETGLIDAHKSHLNQQWLPPTSERGSVQIDYIFVSPGIGIKRAGFLPFGKFPGDHRAIWIEVNTKDMIGVNPECLNKMNARRLKLQDPRTVKAYQNELLNRITSENLDQEIKSLFKVEETHWTKEHETRYNTVAEKYRRHMIEAEKRCRKLKMGGHPWSIEFANARNSKFFWEWALKRSRGIAIPTKKFLKLKKKLKIIKSDIKEIELIEKVKQSNNKYRMIKRQSRKLRQTYREQLVDAVSKEKNTKKEAELKALVNREQMKETYRKIRYYRYLEQNTAITSITVKDRNGREKIISEKDKIEDILLETNEKKFLQTKGQCPLMKGTLRQHFGTTATNPQSDKVIKGSYQSPVKCRTSTKKFLEACKQPPSFEACKHHHLSLAQYRESWKATKERTSSGVVHVGLWKAGALHNTLSELEWMLSNIPGIQGFSPKVWRQATDVMLLKKAGHTDVEKLRTIVLYEADYNFINKRIGKQAMDNAMSNGLMAEEQFAKPHCDSISQCVNRKLIFDLVRLAKSSFAMCSSDLKSCYDRIVHSAASLAIQKMGITKNQARSMFLTIQNCKHKVRTTFGDSEGTYGGETRGNEEPLLGVGQGNGAGPAIWAIISSVLFQAMHAEGLSIEFAAKLSKDIVKIVGFMYVDDMDLIRVLPGREHENITEELQLALDFWNKLVKVTGGTLAPEKSQWYAFYHEWNAETGEYIVKDVLNKSLTAKDQKDERKSLAFLSNDSPQEMLGVLMAPNGDSTHQVKKLIESSRKDAQAIGRSKLLPHEAKIAITHTIVPKLQYPLVATSINKTEGKQIMRPILETSLQKMGIIKMLGYDYIHGAIETQGLGIPELYHVSYSKQIEFIISNTWRNNQAAKLIKMAVQDLLIEMGTSYEIFDNKAPERLDKTILTRNTWIQRIRSYIREQRIEMKFRIPRRKKQRYDDLSIMDVLSEVETSRFTNKELRDFNKCRIYKKVRLISDIAEETGSMIATRSWNQDQLIRGTSDQYPVQHMPTETQWRTWKKGLKLLSHNGGYLNNPVREWIPDFLKEANWDYYLDSSNKRLYRVIHKTWYTHRYTGRRWITPLKFSRESFISQNPPTLESLKPVTVIIQDEEYVAEISSVAEIQNTGREEMQDESRIERRQDTLSKRIKDYAMSHYSDAKWALATVEEEGDSTKIIEAFKKGESLFVGDGSFKNEEGAGSFVVASKDGAHYISFSGPTPGPTSSQSAYRSEVGTILGSAIVATTLEYLTQTSPKITVVCDNEKALRSSLKSRDVLKTSTKSADLISTTMDIWKNSKLKIEIKDVKGHADELREEDNLTVEEKLNIVVDKKAKEELSKRSAKNTQREDTNLGLLQLRIGEEEVTDNYAKKIQLHSAKQRSKDAGIRLNRFTEETYSMINHEALAKAMLSMTIPRQIFVTKWISKQLPVGLNLIRRKQRIHNKCPYCMQEEDTEHLWKCQNEDAIKVFLELLEGLEEELINMKTDHTIQVYLLLALTQWRESGKVSPNTLPSSIGDKDRFKPFADQQKIGWNQFMEGLLALTWAEAHEKHRDKLINKTTGERWTKRIIQYIWKMNREIWEHRNKQLHDNQKLVEELEGGLELDQVIRQEYLEGPDNLHRDLSNLFDVSLEDLLKKPIQAKKNWFLLIRTAKESLAIDRQDNFSQNGSLRKWVGLKKK
jgi:exonuclease III